MMPCSKEETGSLIIDTERAAVLLYQGDIVNAQVILDNILPQIQDIYQRMLNACGNIEVEIPIEVLYSQFQNAAEAIDCKDVLQLADTLYFEIREGLLFYQEIRDKI